MIMARSNWIYMICVMRSSRGKHLFCTTGTVRDVMCLCFCVFLSLAELLVTWKPLCRRPPKMCVWLCFALFSTASHAAVCTETPLCTVSTREEIRMEVCGRTQQKIDFGVRQLSYPFFNFSFNSTKIIQLTCLHDSCNNLSTALIWL